MKRLSLLLLTFNFVMVFGQETVGSFEYREGRVIWERVYEFEGNPQKIEKKIRSIPYFKFDPNTNRGRGESVLGKSAFKEFCQQRFPISGSLRSDMMCDVNLDFLFFVKDGRYKIVVSRMKGISYTSLNLGGTGRSTQQCQFDLQDSYNPRAKKFRSRWANKMLWCWDQSLTNMFQLKNVNSGDW